jgi:hypothetical protein
MVAVVVVHGADEDHLVGMAGVQRQDVGDANAGDVGLDRAVGTAILGRGVGLGIIGFELAGPAVEPDEDDRLVTGGGPLGAGLEGICQG